MPGNPPDWNRLRWSSRHCWRDTHVLEYAARVIVAVESKGRGRRFCILICVSKIFERDGEPVGGGGARRGRAAGGARGSRVWRGGCYHRRQHSRFGGSPVEIGRCSFPGRSDWPAYRRMSGLTAARRKSR